MPVTKVRAKVKARMRQSGSARISSGCVVGWNQPDQSTRHPDGEQQAQQAAGDREHQALDEQLPDELPARRAQRQPDRDLPLARKRARDEQVGHVGAGDQEDEADHAHQDDERRREVVPERGVADRGLLDAQLALEELLAVVGRPVLRALQGALVLANLREEHLERRLCRFDGLARLQAREYLHPPRSRAAHLEPVPLRHDDGLHQQRDAERRRAGRIHTRKAAGRDADDRHRIVVDEDLPADRRRIEGEAAIPVVVAQHDDRMAPVDLIVFLRVEDASRRRSHAEHGEEVARHHLGVHALGLVLDADGRGHEPAGDHLGQRLGALLVLLINRIRVHARAHVAAVVRPLLVEHHQFIGVLHGQPTQQDLIDERVDSGVRADAERQRQDRDDREQRAAAQPAQRHTEVVTGQHHGGLDGRGGPRVGSEGESSSWQTAGLGDPNVDRPQSTPTQRRRRGRALGRPWVRRAAVFRARGAGFAIATCHASSMAGFSTRGVARAGERACSPDAPRLRLRA